MRSRAVRVTLTLLSVGAIGGAAYYYWTTLARINASLQSASSFSEARAAAARAAYDLSSAQQAYVAAGQSEAFWFERSARSLEALRAAVTVLERETTSAPARASLADVAAAAADFEARDRRVRGYVAGGQRLLASDIIFSDGIELTARIFAGLDAATEQAALETAAVRASAFREQMLALGAAAAVAMLTLLLLTSPGHSRPEETAVETPSGEGVLKLELRPAAPSSVPAAGARKQPTLRPGTPGAPIRLEDLAGVCADLARLSDTGAIPAILERAASVLDASGLVLWIAEADGGDLLPIAAHGFAPDVLARMRGVRKDSENVTAGAFRTGLVQIVRGNGTANGAIAAPLVSPAGPLGVLSLEMRQGGEDRPERLAAATIVASQLATIVGPPAAQSADRSIG